MDGIEPIIGFEGAVVLCLVSNRVPRLTIPFHARDGYAICRWTKVQLEMLRWGSDLIGNENFVLQNILSLRLAFFPRHPQSRRL